MMKKSQRLNKTTDGLRQRLDVWRRSHRPRAPIPPELWDQAVDLAGEQGLWKTARSLRLDYYALKKRIDARSSNRPASPVPEFVEFFAPVSSQVAECSLDVESAQGGRLRIKMKNIAISGLTSIIREFAG